MTKIPDQETLLEMATEFKVDSCRLWRWHIRISRVAQQDDSVKWAVYLNRHEVWDRIAQDFVYDPMPSSRTKKYYSRTRFVTLTEAWKQAQKAAKLTRARYAEEDALRAAKSS